MFIDKLMNKVKEMRNPTVMGLDPRLDYVPSSIRKRIFNYMAIVLKQLQKVFWSLTRN